MSGWTYLILNAIVVPPTAWAGWTYFRLAFKGES
jgi:hypothetical protein